MILWFSLLNRLKRIKNNGWLFFLEVLSISIILYITIIFICQVLETQKRISFFRKKSSTSHYAIQIRPDDAFSIGTTQRFGEAYARNGMNTYKVQITGIDERYPIYCNDGLIPPKQRAAFYNAQVAVLSFETAAKLKVHQGETFLLGDMPCKVLSLTSLPTWKNQLVLSNACFSKIKPKQNTGNSLTVSKEEFHENRSLLTPYAHEQLSERYRQEVKMQRIYLFFLSFFTFIFYLIAFCNMFLILFTKVRRNHIFYKILLLAGEDEICNWRATFMETLALYWLAFHFSILVALLTRPLLPSFFYFRFSLKLYIIGLFFTFFSCYFLTNILCKANRQSIIQDRSYHHVL